jgi:hypothetical protein
LDIKPTPETLAALAHSHPSPASFAASPASHAASPAASPGVRIIQPLLSVAQPPNCPPIGQFVRQSPPPPFFVPVGHGDATADYINSPDLMHSPQPDAYGIYAASSPSPSVASVHSHHSHSGVRSPGFAEPVLTFHASRTFAGFVDTAPLTSPINSQPNFSISPVSPFANTIPNIAAACTPGRRLSVSSVASSNFAFEGNMEWQDPLSTPEKMEMTIPDSHNAVNGSLMSQQELGQHSPPPWSELKTKAGKDRKRLPLACIACRRKKIRCSGQKPACKHCLRSRVPCVYKVNARKATPRTDYMAMLDKRLKRMEERVIRLIPKDGNATSVPRAILKPTHGHNLSKSPKRGTKRTAQEASGAKIDFDSWARSGPGASGFDPPPHPSRADNDTSLLTDGAEHLPPMDIQLHLAETYFEFVYGQSYPLLHKPTFMRNLVTGSIPPVLVLSVCAISARFSSHHRLRTEPAFLRGEEWARPAREIALRRYDAPNITVLTSYLLLALHEFGTCQGKRSWVLGGMAQRMVFMLQLHKDEDKSVAVGGGDINGNVDGTVKGTVNGTVNGTINGSDPSAEQEMSHTDKEIRRRVMWSCFIMDRFVSSGTDRPLTFPEDCIYTPLPVKESMFLMGIGGPTEYLDGSPDCRSPNGDAGQASNMGTSAYILRLVAIWGRLVAYFNLGGREAEKVPMWHPESQFQELTERLREFRFPAELAWNEDNLASFKAEKEDNQYIFMHIVYQHLRLFCHRWAIPGYGRPVPANSPQPFHADSVKIALDAANEVSYLVREALRSNLTAPFAAYAAYYSATVHIQGLFANSGQYSTQARINLETNIRFLGKMKRWWGMFHFVVQALKELYSSHVATDNGLDVGQGRRNSHIFQYGDWFDKYPSGVSSKDYEDAAKTPKESEKVEYGVLGGQKRTLLTVEEYFVRNQEEEAEKDGSRKKPKKGRKTSDPPAPSGGIPEPTSATTPVKHPDDMYYAPILQPVAVPMDYSSFAGGNPYLPGAADPRQAAFMRGVPNTLPSSPADGAPVNVPDRNRASGAGVVWGGMTGGGLVRGGANGAAGMSFNQGPVMPACGGLEFFMPWNVEMISSAAMQSPTNEGLGVGPAAGLDWDSWAEYLS